MYERAIELLSRYQDLYRDSRLPPGFAPHVNRQQLREIEAELRSLPPFAERPSHYRKGYGSGGVLQAAGAAVMFVMQEANPRHVTESIARLLDENQAEFQEVWSIQGIQGNFNISLGDGFHVESVAPLHHLLGPITIAGEHEVLNLARDFYTTAKIVETFRLSPVFTNGMMQPDRDSMIRSTHKFEDILTALQLAADGPVSLAYRTTIASDPYFPTTGSGGASYGIDVAGTEGSRTSLEGLADLHAKMIKFEPTHKVSLRLAVDRLAASRRNDGLAMKALNLGVALEILTTHNDNSKSDNVERVSIRGALLARDVLEERRQARKEIKDLYNHRSDAAHKGVVNPKFAVDFAKYNRLVTEIAVAIVSRGSFPRWDDLQLAGC